MNEWTQLNSTQLNSPQLNSALHLDVNPPVAATLSFPMNVVPRQVEQLLKLVHSLHFSPDNPPEESTHDLQPGWNKDLVFIHGDLNLEPSFLANKNCTLYQQSHFNIYKNRCEITHGAVAQSSIHYLLNPNWDEGGGRCTFYILSYIRKITLSDHKVTSHSKIDGFPQSVQAFFVI